MQSRLRKHCTLQFLLLPDNRFAAGQLVSQEAQDGGLLGRRVGLESLGLQTEGQRGQFCVGTMGAHVHL